MKYFYFLILLLVIGNVTYSQSLSEKENSKRIGLTVSVLGDSDIIHFGKVLGSATYDGTNYYSIGVNYIYPINNWLEIEIALEYSMYEIKATSPIPNSGEPSYHNLYLIDIPVLVRANFLKYFFANGGVLLDFDMSESTSIDNQSGVGGMLGIGAKYNFNFGLSVFINPYIKLHSIIPFSREGSLHQRLIEGAIRLGVNYEL